MSLDASDPSFVEDLRSSHAAVEHVARWMREKWKLPVLIQPTYVRPSADERMDYSDSGDLAIQQRIEVKWRKIDFDSAAAFPYSTVLVDTKHAYDRATPKPLLYVITNRSLTGALLVYCRRTSDKWIVKHRRDGHIGRARDYYECPVRECEYVDLTIPA